MNLQGLAAIVTGGGSGMGAATARALAARGAKVAVIDLNEAAVSETAEATGGIGIVCDVTSAHQMEAAFATAAQHHGPCALAVACAGVATAGRILGKEGVLSLESFKRVVDINLNGSFNLLRLAAADMQTRTPDAEGQRGVILTVASVAGYEGQIGQAAYAASKGGVIAMTLPSARELARFGIRVNCIAPGLIETPMLGGMREDVRESLLAQTVFPPRLGKPEEFAALALSIIDNAYLNGTVIRFDGAVRLPAK